MTELVFILDRSGSMTGLEGDTIGGFNSMLKKQKAQEGEANVTTVLFDNQYELLHDRIDIRAVAELTDDQYFTRGSTALLDAVGLTIQKLKNVLKNTSEEYRAENVIFVITTDGEENASKEYNYRQISKLIKEQTKAGWEFLFLGANIDAAETAQSMGINRERAANYHADSAGTQLNYEVLSETIAIRRKGMEIPEDWSAQIDKDYTERK